MVTTEQALEALVSMAINATTALPDVNGDVNDTAVTIGGPTKFVPRSALNFAELDNYWAYRTALKVTKNKYYFLVPFSLICNMFCFAVLFKRITKGSAYMFMANIAIWDSLTILFKGIIIMTFVHGWNIGDTGCTIVTLLVSMFPPVAEWLVILLTADRVVAVWFPFKYRQLCTMPRAIAAYAFVVVMILCVCVNNFWMVEAFDYPPYFYCMFKAQYAEETQRFLWAYLAFQSFIPTAIMILLNAALVYRVRQAMASMEDAKNPGGGKSNKMSTENHVTLMALTIAVSFVLLTGPFCGFNAAIYLWDYDKDLDTYVTYAVVQCVVYILYDLNHTLNVFLYFLSGARFRSDAMQLVTCGRRGGKRKYMQTSGGGKTAMSTATSVSVVSQGV